MEKILALDVGDEWIGTALSDALAIIAKPFKTIHRSEFEEFLKNIITQENLKTIVIGYPKTMRGKISQQTQKVIDFHKKIIQKFPHIKFVLWDERLSTKRAELIKKRNQDKKQLHSIAAAFILDSYLNNLTFQKELQSS